jgi:hypothetical protein
MKRFVIKPMFDIAVGNGTRVFFDSVCGALTRGVLGERPRLEGEPEEQAHN